MVSPTELQQALKTQNWHRVYQLLRHTELMPDVPMEIFHNFPECSVQRDTAERARLWLRQRGAEHHPPHKDVAVAVLPDVAMKLDGHTRDWLWTSGELDIPPTRTVNIRIYHPANQEEAISLYEDFDNPVTMLKPKDLTVGVERLTGKHLASNFLRGGHARALHMSKALMTADYSGAYDRGRSEHDRLMALKRLFHPVLATIDGYHPDAKFFQAQILTACIIATVVDGPGRSLDGFFGPYLDEASHRLDGTAKNAFRLLYELRQDKSGPMHHYSGSAELENIKRVLHLYEEHMYRMEHGLSEMIERGPAGHTIYLKPGKNPKKLDMTRYAIGVDAMHERIMTL